MNLLRWPFTILAAILGWYIGVVMALLAHMGLQRSCPAEYVVSQTCHAPWSGFGDVVFLAAGSLVSGTLAVLLPTLVAPCHRIRVARLAYAAGLLSSAYWLAHEFWHPVGCAALAGAVTLWRIQRALSPKFAP